MAGGSRSRKERLVETDTKRAVPSGAAFVLLPSFTVADFPFLTTGGLGMILGFLGGSAFAVILSLNEHHRSLDELSLKRVALWGGIGGAAFAGWNALTMIGNGAPFAVVFSAYLIPIGLCCLLGAGFSAGSVAIARQGDRKLIEGQRESLLSLEEDRTPKRVG